MKGVLACIGTVGFLGIIVLMMWGCSTYNVWNQEMKGKSELARAEQNKQIMFIEAQAMLEAEHFNAEAEIVRARGMAEAMEIEGGTLTIWV
jgi:regulator of protease activity HflC (stomatin/prohibitin superfamily)